MDNNNKTTTSTTPTLQDLASALPDSVKANALELVERMGTVVEGIGDEAVTWRPPFLKLVQGSTDRSQLPKGCGVGDMIIGEEKIEQPLKFLPIRLWTARQYWDQDLSNTRMLCQSPDAKMGYIGMECKVCPRSIWKDGSDGSKVGSDCSKVFSMLAITSDLKHIFNVNFGKSGYKVGQELSSAMTKAGVATYLRTYGLTSETSAKAKNVDIFKLEILDTTARRTPTEYAPFLKALFDEASANRKAMLDSFYESAVRRKGTIMIANEADSTLALPPAGDSAIGGDTVAVAGEVAQAKVEAKVSTMGKKYSV